MISKPLVTILFSAFLCLATVASAFVASSSNYVLQSDSMNFGGVIGSSTSYSMEDTFGELGTGYSSSTSYDLHAGYQQSGASSTISITEGGNVTLSTIRGKAGDSSAARAASGVTSLTVVTDNATGYNLKVRAGSSPAFTSGSNSFADYSPDGSVWGENVGVGESKFGFAVSGDDIPTGYTGKWYGFSSVTEKLIANRSSATGAGGVSTSLTLQAEAGLNVAQPAGSYSAQIIATATIN